MSPIQEAMARADEADNVVEMPQAEPSRAQQIHQAQQTLPSVRKEGMKAQWLKAIEQLEVEITQRQAVATAGVEKIRAEADDQIALIRASLGELIAAKAADMANYAKGEDALREDLDATQTRLKLRETEINAEAQKEMRHARDMISMLRAGLEGSEADK